MYKDLRRLFCVAHFVLVRVWWCVRVGGRGMLPPPALLFSLGGDQGSAGIRDLLFFFQTNYCSIIETKKNVISVYQVIFGGIIYQALEID
jgi:hypothetical protein